MKRTNHKFIKIGLVALSMIAITGALPVTSNNVYARNQRHIHRVIKKNIKSSKRRNKVNKHNSKHIDKSKKSQALMFVNKDELQKKRKNNKAHKKSSKIIKPRMMMASNIYLLKKQISDINMAIGHDKKKKQPKRVLALNIEKEQINQQIKRIAKNDSYLAHSPKAKQNYNWLAQNGLQSYNKLYHHNKMYHLGFNDGASTKSNDSVIRNKYSKNKTYEKGWLVGYASKITKDNTFPKAKTYYKAFLAYNHGSMFARHNVISKVYLEIANTWGRYDI